MKRLIISFSLLLLPFTASAGTDLAQQWGQEASRLSGETVQMMLSIDLGEEVSVSDAYALDVYRFGRTSADLAVWIDDTKGPNDLGCIFRGMAAESEDQLETLEMSSETMTKRESLRRLASMFSDAEMISVAAQRRAPTPGLLNASATSSCPADAAAALNALR